MVDADSTLPWLVNGSSGNQPLHFELRDLLLKSCILRTQSFVFFLVFSRDVLQCNAAFRFPLFVDLDASLELGNLGLPPLPECSLGGPVYVVSSFFT